MKPSDESHDSRVVNEHCLCSLGLGPCTDAETKDSMPLGTFQASMFGQHDIRALEAAEFAAAKACAVPNGQTRAQEAVG